MTKHTLQGTKRKRIKTSGFKSRMKTSSGSKVVRLRRQKGRKKITLSSNSKR